MPRSRAERAPNLRPDRRTLVTSSEASEEDIRGLALGSSRTGKYHDSGRGVPTAAGRIARKSRDGRTGFGAGEGRGVAGPLSGTRSSALSRHRQLDPMRSSTREMMR